MDELLARLTSLEYTIENEHSPACGLARHALERYKFGVDTAEEALADINASIANLEDTVAKFGETYSTRQASQALAEAAAIVN